MQQEIQDAQNTLAREPSLADRFEVMRILGHGSSAAVYQVLDRNRNKLMALKVLTNPKAFLESTIQRFIEEFHVCQSIEHANLVRAYDLFETKNIIAFTTEYVDGADLGRIMETRQLSTAEIDLIFEQLLSALEELHKRSIVHRDIKPENLILSRDLWVKVVDLGLVKRMDEPGITKSGVILGTAQYMPPEYVRTGTHDSRGDIYACGMVLFELVSGKRRLKNYRGTEVLELLDRTDFALPPIALQGLPKKYAEIIKRAIAVDPDRRYQTAAAMRDAFAYHFDDGSVEIVQQLSPSIEIERYSTEMTQQITMKRKAHHFVWLIVAAVGIMLAAVAFLYFRLQNS